MGSEATMDLKSSAALMCSTCNDLPCRGLSMVLTASPKASGVCNSLQLLNKLLTSENRWSTFQWEWPTRNWVIQTSRKHWRWISVPNVFRTNWFLPSDAALSECSLKIAGIFCWRDEKKAWHWCKAAKRTVCWRLLSLQMSVSERKYDSEMPSARQHWNVNSGRQHFSHCFEALSSLGTLNLDTSMASMLMFKTDLWSHTRHVDTNLKYDKLKNDVHHNRPWKRNNKHHTDKLFFQDTFPKALHQMQWKWQSGTIEHPPDGLGTYFEDVAHMPGWSVPHLLDWLPISETLSTDSNLHTSWTWVCRRVKWVNNAMMARKGFLNEQFFQPIARRLKYKVLKQQESLECCPSDLVLRIACQCRWYTLQNVEYEGLISWAMKAELRSSISVKDVPGANHRTSVKLKGPPDSALLPGPACSSGLAMLNLLAFTSELSAKTSATCSYSQVKRRCALATLCRSSSEGFLRPTFRWSAGGSRNPSPRCLHHAVCILWESWRTSQVALPHNGMPQAQNLRHPTSFDCQCRRQSNLIFISSSLLVHDCKHIFNSYNPLLAAWDSRSASRQAALQQESESGRSTLLSSTTAMSESTLGSEMLSLPSESDGRLTASMFEAAMSYWTHWIGTVQHQIVGEEHVMIHCISPSNILLRNSVRVNYCCSTKSDWLKTLSFRRNWQSAHYNLNDNEKTSEHQRNQVTDVFSDSPGASMIWHYSSTKKCSAHFPSSLRPAISFNGLLANQKLFHKLLASSAGISKEGLKDY